MPERLSLDTMPPFDAVLDRYGLALLRRTVDLRVENGDLALTKWGDLTARFERLRRSA